MSVQITGAKVCWFDFRRVIAGPVKIAFVRDWTEERFKEAIKDVPPVVDENDGHIMIDDEVVGIICEWQCEEQEDIDDIRSEKE